MKKLWQTNWELDKKVEAFETKEDLAMDQKLLKYDILGTKAHAKSLLMMGFYRKNELKKVLDCLNSLTILVEQGKFHLKMGDKFLWLYAYPHHPFSNEISLAQLE